MPYLYRTEASTPTKSICGGVNDVIGPIYSVINVGSMFLSSANFFFAISPKTDQRAAKTEHGMLCRNLPQVYRIVRCRFL